MWDGGIYFKYSEVAVGEFFFFGGGGTPFFQMIMQESVALLKAVKSVLLVLCFHRRWFWIDSSCVFILSRYILSSLLSRILVIFSFFSSLHPFFSPSFSIVIIRLHLNVSVLVLATLVLGLTFVDECGGGGSVRKHVCCACPCSTDTLPSLSTERSAFCCWPHQLSDSMDSSSASVPLHVCWGLHSHQELQD